MVEIKIITRQMRANTAANRFKDCHKQSRLWETSYKKKWMALVSLGDNPKPEDVDEITERGSWTKTTPCAVCEEQKDVAFETAIADPINESGCACICLDCVKKLYQEALKFEGEKP